jgi:Ca-activated chloride channel homolog
MNIDDPKLTAYALDELDEAERAAIAHEVAASPQAQRDVQETQTLARLLRKEFAAELSKEAPLRANLSDIRDDPWFWSIARPLAIAAVLAVFAVIGLAIFGSYKLHQNQIAQASRQRIGLPPKSDAVEVEIPELQKEPSAPALTLAQPGRTPSAFYEENRFREGLLRDLSKPHGLAGGGDDKTDVLVRSEIFDRPPVDAVAGVLNFSRDGDVRTQKGKFNTTDYGHFVENPFLAALDNPLSTFSVDVDTASYSVARRFINDGQLPPKDAVRVEEMINYFTYDYPQPKADEPFSINADVANCPWEETHRLVRIGLKGREIAQDKRGPSNLVFLLDVSGSMMPPERLPLVKQAMRLLVEKLTENDRVAIVVYAGASGLALPSTTGAHKEQILSALESLQAGGSTNGAEGIQLAYKVATDNFIKGGVNRVILATDGDFNVGVTSQGELIRLLEEKAMSGVFLSVLGVGDDNLKDSTMQKLADKGNGNYAYIDSLDEARKVLVQQMNGTLVTIAKDVKVQVEFNPARVASYRLIGYEKRMLRKEDFNNDKLDAGEIGAGHIVTALYEIVPAGAAVSPSVPPVDPLKYSVPPENTRSNSNETLTVKLRYKRPDGDKSELIERAVVDDGKQFANASADFKFAAAVAEFGILLRDSEFKGNGTLGAVLEWAQEGKGADRNGYRAGFLELVRKAEAIKKG